MMKRNGSTASNSACMSRLIRSYSQSVWRRSHDSFAIVTSWSTATSWT